jgi:hypothetical protein
VSSLHAKMPIRLNKNPTNFQDIISSRSKTFKAPVFTLWKAPGR